MGAMDFIGFLGLTLERDEAPFGGVGNADLRSLLM